MKLSTKTRYALRAIISLAHTNGDSPVAIHNIAEEINVSKKYLESLLLSLKNANLVRSTRGINGGYLLAKSPKEITAYDVCTAVEGPVSIVDCVQDSSICERADECVSRKLWNDINQAIIKVLQENSIKDLAEEEVKSNAVVK